MSIENFIQHGVDAQKAADRILLLHRIRLCLNRWAARYAESDHAKAQSDETRVLIKDIDTWIEEIAHPTVHVGDVPHGTTEQPPTASP